MDWTLSYPRQRWARLSWRGRTSQVPQAAQALQLDPIPGVRVVATHDGGFVEMPDSTYALGPIYALFDVAEKQTPHRPIDKTHAARLPVGLFKHQASALFWLGACGGGLLADDMGCGKSAVAAYAADALAEPDAPRLIIGPQYVRDVWRSELGRLGLLRDARDFVALRGLDDSDGSVLEAGRWWFCHYDIIGPWSQRLNFNARGRARVAIIDEGHHLRNAKARRTRAAMFASGAVPHRIVLTGTPLVNRPGDLWPLLTIIDGPRAWGSLYDFRVRYAGAVNDTGFGHRDTFPTHVDELRKRLEGKYLRRTKAEVGLDLPAMTRSTISTELRTSDRKAHDAHLAAIGMKPHELVDALLQGALSNGVLAALTHLRQLTSAAKLGTTAEYVAAALEQGQSVVVFAHERKTVADLAGRIVRLAPEGSCMTALHGEVAADARDAHVRMFQERGSTDCIVATYGALREGVTLTRASVVVLHDLTWRPDEILQAEARVHRIGQNRGVQSVWSIADASIDTIFARVLAVKASVHAAVLGMDDAQAALAQTDLLARVGVATIEEEAQRILGAWR